MISVKTHFKKFQYFYPYTVALVGARAGKRVNFMSCAWHTALSFEPPLFGVLVSRKRLTHEVITEAREFTVNFLGFDRIKLSAQMGRKSGRDFDKVKEFGVNLRPAKVSPPRWARPSSWPSRRSASPSRRASSAARRRRPRRPSSSCACRTGRSGSACSRRSRASAST